MPPQLAIEQADLARLQERHAQLGETLGKWRDYTDQAPGWLESMEKTISRDAAARLGDAIRARQFAPELARDIIDRAGPWPSNPGPARDRWEASVAPVVQHHALTGHNGTVVAVYSRAQLRAITGEIHDPRVPASEKTILRQASTTDAYERLDHALNNQHDIPADLADHVIERLGPRAANLTNTSTNGTDSSQQHSATTP